MSTKTGVNKVCEQGNGEGREFSRMKQRQMNLETFEPASIEQEDPCDLSFWGLIV